MGVTVEQIACPACHKYTPCATDFIYAECDNCGHNWAMTVPALLEKRLRDALMVAERDTKTPEMVFIKCELESMIQRVQDYRSISEPPA